MTSLERRLAVRMAKRIHAVQGNARGLASGVYMMMTAIWLIIVGLAGIVFVFIGTAGHNTIVSLVSGPIMVIAAVCACLRMVQHRRTLQQLLSEKQKADE
jgi:hypothetical protein